MQTNNSQSKKTPKGQATGETAIYAVSLLLFLFCGMWMPYRNFNLIEQRIGEGGEMPPGAINAMELTTFLYNWQGVLIVLFIVLTVYFWWTSTWLESVSKKLSRFLLWCIPAGLYVVMMWVLYWLHVPLGVAGTYTQ